MPDTNDGIPEDIHAGKCGHLFLVHGSNNVISQYNKSRVMRWLLWQWRHAIYTRDRRLRAMGITYKHITTPEKLSIYDNLLDGIEINWKLSPAFRLYQEDPYFQRYPQRMIWLGQYFRRRKRWHNILIDLVQPFRSFRDDLDIYLKTDSHWTFEGRLIAYRELCRSLGAKPISDFRERSTQYYPNYVGDLGGACEPPRTEGTTIYSIQRDAVRIFASPIVEHRERTGRVHTLHIGSNVVYHNDKASDNRKVVLFGDSYSHFAPIMLTIMIAETFREVHFVWSTSIDWSYVENTKPDIVITEMAERFIFREPNDEFNLSAYVRERFKDELEQVADNI